MTSSSTGPRPTFSRTLRGDAAGAARADGSAPGSSQGPTRHNTRPADAGASPARATLARIAPATEIEPHWFAAIAAATD